MISGLENYKRAIEFQNPAYLPCRVGVNCDWLHENNPGGKKAIADLLAQFPEDTLHWQNAAMAAAAMEKDGKRIWQDEWGTGWEDDGYGEKAEIFPMRNGYPENLDYAWPDAAHPNRFLQLDRHLQQRGDKYVQAAVWFTLFERMWMLRGFDKILIDPYLELKNFLWLRDKIMEFNLAMIDLWLKRGVHAVFFSDDWGSQTRLLINPNDWRRFFKPCYQQLFTRVRDAGAHVWYHSCGNVTQIIPDLLDLGVNVLHPIQPQAMNVSELARDYGGKVCFFGGVDVQGTLIHGSTDDVRNEVHHLVNTLGNFNGGYIGGTSHSVMPETPVKNIIAMLETFLEYSVG